jgi:putative endonuclease
VIVEVKTRTGLGFGTPTMAVTPVKYARLRRLAAQWVDAHDIHPHSIRIDVMGVLMDRGGQLNGIDHIEGAFL